jgi:pimeloyl-ACP methyl ester carboxylesterase
MTTLSLLCVTLLPATSIATQFLQVAPQLRTEGQWARHPEQGRAVVLIHGLKVEPWSGANDRASLRGWQRPGSALVKRLSREADVYSFAYAQSVGVDGVAEAPELVAGVQRLRRMGYVEVVLVGFSAGGLVARRLVEDHPDVGVTKVVQVCSPNGGSGWARLEAVRASQRSFLRSLTKEDRQHAARARLDVRIPENVDFVCVVWAGAWLGDGVVSCRSQWTADLQEQGIPAVKLFTDHLSAVRTWVGAEKIADLVRMRQPRWTQTQVAAARKAILGK